MSIQGTRSRQVRAIGNMMAMEIIAIPLLNKRQAVAVTADNGKANSVLTYYCQIMPTAELLPETMPGG